MRKIITTCIIALFAISCEQDSSISNEGASNSDGQGGSLAIFALAGDYLYTVDEQDLTVFNISNSENPVQVNTVAIGFSIETIFNFKNYLYIGSESGMFIYSIDNPEFPEYLSSVEHFTACDPVVANETHAFVTLWSDLGCGNNVNQLEVYNVEDVLNPILVNTRELVFPKGLGLYGDYLFICDDEIKVFDISDPAASILVHSIEQVAFDVIIRNNTLISIGSQSIAQYSLDANNITKTPLLSELEF